MLLRSARAGDAWATHRLMPCIYDELRAVAHRHLARERDDHTLATTALVHEAYLKLVDGSQVTWQDRQHFCALASRAMRQLLVDYARRRNAEKRGGGATREPLLPEMLADEPTDAGLLALDEALTALEQYNPRLARLVELRFFGGLNMAEAGAELGYALRSAERAWTRARAFLLAHMSGDLQIV
ncbi:MAG TPA: ECF-type sigma factor [Rhodothermales bacterium]|nr:ECF-type sigma factor [Rhodothermales bacterium]